MRPHLSDLRIAVTSPANVAVYPPGATFGPRRLRDFEFVWMIEGDVEYRRGESTLAAPAGTVLLCRPGEEDFFRWDTSRQTRHAYFHFTLESIPPAWPAIQKWPLARPPTQGDILRPLFGYLLNWAGTGDPLVGELAIAQMVGVFITGQIAAERLRRNRLPDPVERALRFVHDTMKKNPAAPILLAEMADAAAVTAPHLCRLFKNTTGLTPATTVRLARLDRAAVLLARSNYSITQIAELCGFATPFHFSRRFKEAFGSSPRAIRQEMRINGVPPLPRLPHPGTGP